MQARPWKPSEYQVLRTIHEVEAIAKHLGRSVEDVSRKVDLTYREWYARHRCLGSPRSPDRLLRLATKIYRDDMHESSTTDGELTAMILDVTRACFKAFDPAKWRKDAPVQRKFAGYFALCLRRRLKKARRSHREHRTRFRPFDSDIAAHVEEGRVEWLAWAKLLMGRALARLKPQARRFIEYRYLQGLDIPGVAERLGLKVQTVYNKYSFNKVKAMIKNEVREMILSMPEENLKAVVHYLLYGAELNRKAIAELLCIPRPVVDRLLDGAIETIMRNMEKQQARQSAMSLMGK